MRTPISVTVLIACLAAACSGRESGGDSGGERDDSRAAEPSASQSQVLPGVPIMAGSDQVERSGTPEALQLVFLVPVGRDSVASFYRRVLAASGWRIVSDVDLGGVVQLYAERNGPPLWITVQTAGPGAAQYSLIGAKAQDSTAGRPR